MLGTGRGGRAGVDTCHQKGPNFQSLSGMRYIRTNSGKGLKFPKRGSNIPVLKGSLLVWNGVVKLPLPRIGVP